jgi:K+-sensing histidine kinase KdpD
MVPCVVSRKPPGWTSALAAVVAVTLATVAIYALKSVGPVVSLSVVYLLAVLIIAAYWGLALGLLTSLAHDLGPALLPDAALGSPPDSPGLPLL